MNSKQQSGFTLIELVMVIAILGVLAATALPKFIDMKSDANTAALAGVAGALASASSVNYAARVAGGTSKGSAVGDCTSVGSLLQGGLPTGYTITAKALTNGTTDTCTLTQTNGGTTTFAATGIN